MFLSVAMYLKISPIKGSDNIIINSVLIPKVKVYDTVVQFWAISWILGHC